MLNYLAWYLLIGCLVHFLCLLFDETVEKGLLVFVTIIAHAPLIWLCVSILSR